MAEQWDIYDVNRQRTGRQITACYKTSGAKRTAKTAGSKNSADYASACCKNFSYYQAGTVSFRTGTAAASEEIGRI